MTTLTSAVEPGQRAIGLLPYRYVITQCVARARELLLAEMALRLR